MTCGTAQAGRGHKEGERKRAWRPEDSAQALRKAGTRGCPKGRHGRLKGGPQGRLAAAGSAEGSAKRD